MKRLVLLYFTLITLMAPLAVYAELPLVLFPGGSQDIDLPSFGKDIKDADYLALHETKGKFFLANTKISYVQFDFVSTVAFDKPIAYIRNSRLKAGPVVAATVHPNSTPGIPFATKNGLSISLYEKVYHLSKESDGFLLVGEGGRSRLYPGSNDLGVIWAGDIDGDGKLDLIITSGSGDGNSQASCLLLSTMAKRPHLVKQYSCQFYSG